jgi:hypothetical protein
VSVGAEESLTATTTQAESFWNANVPVRNVSITPAGMTLPVSPTGAQPVAGQLRLNGTVSYTIPSEISQGWKSVVEPTGDVTTVATTSFYSIQVPGIVDSVRVISQDSNGHGIAQLQSPTLTIPGSVVRSIVLHYRAMFAGAGEFSKQSLYAALDVGSATGGAFGQTLLIPALGSASQNDACSSLFVTRGVPLAGPAKVEGTLIADGSWRTLKVDLNSLIGTSSLTLRMRFCAATSQPFAGQVELDVAAAGVSMTSQATNFLSASISTDGSAVRLSFIPGASFEPPSLEFTGNVSFPLFGHTLLTWDGRASLTGTLGWPTLGAAKGSANSTVGNKVSLLGARIITPLLSLNPLVAVNGTNIPLKPTGQTINFAPDQIMAPGSHPRLFSIALNFPDDYLSIHVTDSGGRPLHGASITVNGQGKQLRNATTTNADGGATLPLMPGAYSLTVSLGGSEVGAADVQLDSNQSLKIPTTINLTTLRVKDILGSTIQGATVIVQLNSVGSNLATDDKGLVSFAAVANAVYDVSVSIGGVSYYSGTVTTSIDGAVVQLSTSYLSQSMKIIIVSGLVLTLLFVASGFYVLRRYQAKRRI